MQVFNSKSILIFLFVTFVSCHQEDEILPEIDFLSIDRSKYVDPHDMLNYDRRATKAPPDETIEAKTTLDTQNDLKNGPPDSGENIEVSETKYKPECQANISPVKCSCLNNTSLEREKPFLGRFVAILSRTLELKEKHIEDGDVLYIPLLAVVSKRTQFVLSEILKEGGNIHLKNLADLDEVLSNLLILDKKKSEAPGLTIFEMVLSNVFLNPKDWLVAMFIASLWMILWMTYKGYSYSYILSRAILPFGIVSWYWHWNYMDQVASAKRQSDLQKNTDLPEACNPEKLGVLGDMKLWFSKTIMNNPDPCEEYHRAYFTDPTYEVNPLIALFDMLIKVMFHPLGYMGEKLGSFFDGVLRSPFWMYKIPVLVAVLAVLLLILVLAFGYEVHLPFFKIRPSVSSQSPTLPSTEALRDSTRENAIADVHSQCRLDQRAVILGRTCSQVQTIERTTQESPENSPEESVSYAVVGVTQRHSCQQCAVTLGRTSSHVQTIEGTVYECHCLTQRNSHEQRTVTLQHNCSHVQTTEGTVEDSSEDCPENPDSPATKERRTGNPACTRMSGESNSSEVASKMFENVPEKCVVIAPEKSVQT